MVNALPTITVQKDRHQTNNNLAQPGIIAPRAQRFKLIVREALLKVWLRKVLAVHAPLELIAKRSLPHLQHVLQELIVHHLAPSLLSVLQAKSIF